MLSFQRIRFYKKYDKNLIYSVVHLIINLFFCFQVTGLRPGTRYTLRVFAENSMGRSQPFTFTAFTHTDVAERRTGELFYWFA